MGPLGLKRALLRILPGVSVTEQTENPIKSHDLPA